MINTKKIDARSTPQNQIILAASPDDLRQIADRLDAMAKNAKDAESVLYPIASGLMLCYQPESQRIMRELTDPGYSNTDLPLYHQGAGIGQ